MAEEGDGAAKSTGSTALFWWIKAARYVVAMAVMVLIVLMIAHAIRVVLREKKLTITVAGGSVTVSRPENTSDQLSFNLTIQAFNPSGRGLVYYTDIAVFLAGKSPADDNDALHFLIFNAPPEEDFIVGPQLVVTNYFSAQDSNNTNDGTFSEQTLRPYFNYFYNNNTMRGAVLRLNGTLKTEVYSGQYTKPRTVVYCCAPITVGHDDDDDDDTNQQYLSCEEENFVVGDDQTGSSILYCHKD